MRDIMGCCEIESVEEQELGTAEDLCKQIRSSSPARGPWCRGPGGMGWLASAWLSRACGTRHVIWVPQCKIAKLPGSSGQTPNCTLEENLSTQLTTTYRPTLTSPLRKVRLTNRGSQDRDVGDVEPARLSVCRVETSERSSRSRAVMTDSDNDTAINTILHDEMIQRTSRADRPSRYLNRIAAENLHSPKWSSAPYSTMRSTPSTKPTRAESARS